MSKSPFGEGLHSIDTIEIHPSKVTKIKSIGSGGFAEVFIGEWEGNTIAIKQVNVKNLNTELLKDFRNEVSLLAKCRHPCVVHLFGACLLEGCYQLISEFLHSGSLYQKLSDPEEAMQMAPFRLQIALDIARGLNYLHFNNIIHGDLKSTNVLLTNEWRAKITDFGLTQIKAAIEVSSKNRAVARWCAPEILNRNSVRNRASDVWSLGVVFWEIVSRKIPFAEKSNETAIECIKNGEKENIPGDCPPLLASVIFKCWNMNPLERPQALWTIDVLELEHTQKSESEKFRVSNYCLRDKDSEWPPSVKRSMFVELKDATPVSPRFVSNLIRMKDGIVFSNNGSTAAHGGEGHGNIVSDVVLSNGKFKWMMQVDEMGGHYALLGWSF